MKIVMASGGVTSWATALVATETHGVDDVEMVFADTHSEDDPTMRFLTEGAAVLGVPLRIIDAGIGDIWDTFDADGMIGNTRADICSRKLKREPLRRWLDTNRDPAVDVVLLGFDWTEPHRLARSRPHWAPWRVDAPLITDTRDKTAWMTLAETMGLTLPPAYRSRLPHSNCMAYGCVKGGLAYWRRLLRDFPDAYAASERREREFRERTGKDVAILRDRTGGTVTPLPLAVLRERQESQGTLFAVADGDDWGACSCFDIDESDEP